MPGVPIDRALYHRDEHNPILEPVYPEGSPGAKYTGFKNTVQYPITAPEEAILLAQQECSINYSEIALAYDEGRAIWQVIFFPVSENGHITLGGDQSVYLDTNGITQLIVYGE